MPLGLGNGIGTMELISLEDARAQGLKHYFTGKPCKRGHVAKRFTSSRHCTECLRQQVNDWHHAKTESDSEWAASRLKRARDYGRAHKAEASKRGAQWRQNNPERQREYAQAYREDPANRAKRAEWRRKRIDADPGFRMESVLRTRLGHALRGIAPKSKRTRELIGCTPAELTKHLEAQFLPGMSWENYGQDTWHVDHIRPCASFDLTDPEQQQACFHFSNLQPLWAEDNMRKGARVA